LLYTGFSLLSTLPLLVLLFAANHEKYAFAPHNFAITADFLN
jgi:hypothetical protein